MMYKNHIIDYFDNLEDDEYTGMYIYHNGDADSDIMVCKSVKL